MEERLIAELNRWYKKLWETKGSRFIASKRFERTDRFSSLTVYIFSAYILFINLLVIFPKRPILLSDINISFASICASIIILVFSIYLPSRRFTDLSKKFHDCAKEINILYDRVCLRIAANNVDEIFINDLIDEYNKLLKNYEINHSKLDYEMFKVENIKEYREHIETPNLYKFKTLALYFINYYLLYVVVILSPILLYAIYKIF